jgi:Exo-beta-D-glucosaminidase Ig-fold domain/Glycosyl hydrolases family 2/Glycosyl hydrolases family 2, TIM barrel domain/Glycosyl hydrolases family 2, sugar binding domain
MKFRVAFCFLFLSLPVLLKSQKGSVKQVRLSSFQMQSSSVIRVSGSELSGAAYQSADYWFPVTVPCTVLTGLVQNKIYPDPYSGMNNMLIPDASDSFNHQYHLEQYSHLPNEPNPWKKPYWYRTTFFVPNEDSGKRFQLIFKGINYRAEVWVNGKCVADSSRMVGMFAEYSLNLSKEIIAGAANGLAVKIYPLDFPGLPAHPQLNAMGDFYENGGPTGDIGKNVTMLSSVGWDWIPEVRDRNMGIWQPVYLRSSGHTIITRPQITTDLPALPDTSLANITLHLTLSNDRQVSGGGVLSVNISPENFEGGSVSFTREVPVQGSDSNFISLSPRDIKELRIRQPRLWWPNGYGRPNLYRIRIQYLQDGVLSDDTSFVFGVRTVSSKTETVNGWQRRDFYVNGKKVHLVGGAWVPDMMLNRDSLRNDYELHLCRNANVNLVRIWGGGIGETDDFYEIADRYGLMVWQDFWITGDTHGGFKGSADWPVQASVFIDNVVSTVYRIRNHPSLLVWTGGNEGHAREELYNAMRNSVAELDGTRPFIPCSSGFAKTPKEWKASWPDDKPSGVYSGGPYSWVGEKRYFELVDNGKDWLFKDETGIPSQPPYNSISKIIPDLVPDSTLPYPLNNSWGYHDACSGNGKYDIYYQAMVHRFGSPVSLKDFSIKMQLLNAGGYRAIFEAAGHKLNETGGVMLWKLNAAFPSVIWQIYDWYLEPNAGYYFMQNACEPVHLQLNADDSSVMLVNRSYGGLTDMRYEVQLFDADGTSTFKQEAAVNLGPAAVKSLLPMKSLLRAAKGISFVVLNLRDRSGSPVSHNVYWFSPGDDFKSLFQLPVATLGVKVLKSEKSGAEYRWTFEISNPSNKFAFFINPQLWNPKEEIMPCFWSAGYFSLAPGEKMVVSAGCPSVLCPGDPILKVEGLNAYRELLLKAPAPVLNH